MKTRKTFSLHQSERFHIEDDTLPLAAHTALSQANAISNVHEGLAITPDNESSRRGEGAVTRPTGRREYVHVGSTAPIPAADACRSNNRTLFGAGIVLNIEKLDKESKSTNFPSKELTGKRQNGSVLIISLIMLMLLTMVGVSAMQNTGLEERMAGNMRNRNLAFQAAESALRAGENFLTQATLPNFTQAGTNGLYDINGIPPGIYDSWANNTETYSAASDQAAEDPRYVIQRMPNVANDCGLDASAFCQSEMYRVTARGVGGSATAVAVVQSTYKR